MPAPDAIKARIDALEELVVELGQREGAQGKAGVAGEVGPAGPRGDPGPPGPTQPMPAKAPRVVLLEDHRQLVHLMSHQSQLLTMWLVHPVCRSISYSGQTVLSCGMMRTSYLSC